MSCVMLFSVSGSRFLTLFFQSWNNALSRGLIRLAAWVGIFQMSTKSWQPWSWKASSSLALEWQVALSRSDEVERVSVEGTNCLRKDFLYVLDEHLCVDSFYFDIFSLLWCIDDRRKHLLSVATGDHVEALRIRLCLLCYHICFLSWVNQCSLWSLIEWVSCESHRGRVHYFCWSSESYGADRRCCRNKKRKLSKQTKTRRTYE